VSRPPGIRPSARAARGYTLVALVIGMLILTIVVAAVGPALGVIGKRDREMELQFRGKQYARAIGLFQRKYGRYPNTLKELYENNPRTIRKLWKDPMCNCDDWYLLILNTPDANPQTSPTTGIGAPAPPGAPGFQPTPVPTPTPAPQSAFGTPQSAGPIVGVRSKVHKEGLTDWRGQKYYDQWRFIVGDADRATTGSGFDPGSLQRQNPQPQVTPPSM
jgi:type II secretory pathway pseudopilin PulG